MSEAEDYLRKHKIFGRLKPYNPIDERDCNSHSFLTYQNALKSIHLAREELVIEHKREMDDYIELLNVYHKKEMEELFDELESKMNHKYTPVYRDTNCSEPLWEIRDKDFEEIKARLCEKSSVGVSARGKE